METIMLLAAVGIFGSLIAETILRAGERRVDPVGEEDEP